MHLSLKALLFVGCGCFIGGVLRYLTTGSYVLATLIGSLLCFIAGYALANCLSR